MPNDDRTDLLGLPPGKGDEAGLPPFPTPGNAMVLAVYHHGIVTPVAFNVGEGRVDVEQVLFVERTAARTMWVVLAAGGREARIVQDQQTQFYSVSYKPTLTYLMAVALQATPARINREASLEMDPAEVRSHRHSRELAWLMAALVVVAVASRWTPPRTEGQADIITRYVRFPDRAENMNIPAGKSLKFATAKDGRGFLVTGPRSTVLAFMGRMLGFNRPPPFPTQGYVRFEVTAPSQPGQPPRGFSQPITPLR